MSFQFYPISLDYSTEVVLPIEMTLVSERVDRARGQVSCLDNENTLKSIGDFKDTHLILALYWGFNNAIANLTSR